MASAAGLGRSFGLAGTTGVEGTAGAGAAASWPGLKSRRRFGLGAGEMGREGVGAGAVTSAGLLTVFVEVMFSNRARREDTGLIDEPSGPSPLVGSILLEYMLLSRRRGPRATLPATPTPSSLDHQGINARASSCRLEPDGLARELATKWEGD